jgi:hypothetical protein
MSNESLLKLFKQSRSRVQGNTSSQTHRPTKKKLVEKAIKLAEKGDFYN